MHVPFEILMTLRFLVINVYSRLEKYLPIPLSIACVRYFIFIVDCFVWEE